MISYCCWVSRDVTLCLSLQWSSYVATRRRQIIARVRYSSSRATEKKSLVAIAFSLWGADKNFRSTWTCTIYISVKIIIHSSCEIEDFVETHLCKLCVILRSRAMWHNERMVLHADCWARDNLHQTNDRTCTINNIWLK